MRLYLIHFGVEMKIDRIILILLLLFVAIIFMLIGWLFPVKGPFDYIYDDYVRPTRGIPAPPPKKQEIFEDYNEDGEPEWYQLVPLFEIEDGWDDRHRE